MRCTLHECYTFVCTCLLVKFVVVLFLFFVFYHLPFYMVNKDLHKDVHYMTYMYMG